MKTKGKIKICFVSAKAYPLFNDSIGDFIKIGMYGGAEIDIYNLSLWLARDAAYEVEIMVADYGQQDVETYNNVKLTKLHYTNRKYFWTKNNLRDKTIRHASLIKQLFLCDADVYFVEAASEYLGWLAVIGRILKRKKLIFRLASDVDTDLDFYRYDKKTYFLYKFGIRHCDTVISQTESQQKMAKEKLGLSSVIFKNAYPLKKHIAMKDKKYILWVSRGVPLKRPELFVELARRLPFENFVIIIPGNHPIVEEVIKQTSALSNIKYISYVSYLEIQEYYEKAKLFVNTSEYEGFPNTFIQACLAKTPILSFVVNPDNFICSYDLGYVCNDSIEEAVLFIRELTVKKIEYLGNNAIRYVENNHNIESIGREYKKLFSSG